MQPQGYCIAISAVVQCTNSSSKYAQPQHNRVHSMFSTSLLLLPVVRVFAAVMTLAHWWLRQYIALLPPSGSPLASPSAFSSSAPHSSADTNTPHPSLIPPHPFTLRRQQDPKFVYYLSAEFLMGRSLLNTVYNLGLGGEYGKALTDMGYKMEQVADQEHNAALGNGGLGRLAACFLDSIATLDLPGWGYGIRYQ